MEKFVNINGELFVNAEFVEQAVKDAVSAIFRTEEPAKEEEEDAFVSTGEPYPPLEEYSPMDEFLDCIEEYGVNPEHDRMYDWLVNNGYLQVSE